MNITNEQIERLKECYEYNKANLNELAEYIEENGVTDDGLTDVTGSFEQGFNNALELVFGLLGI